MNRPGTEPLSADGVFLAACLWWEKGFGRAISLPFWAAQDLHHRRRLAARRGGLLCLPDPRGGLFTAHWHER
jgi:hypothetical protein